MSLQGSSPWLTMGFASTDKVLVPFRGSWDLHCLDLNDASTGVTLEQGSPLRWLSRGGSKSMKRSPFNPFFTTSCSDMIMVMMTIWMKRMRNMMTASVLFLALQLIGTSVRQSIMDRLYLGYRGAGEKNQRKFHFPPFFSFRNCPKSAVAASIAAAAF